MVVQITSTLECFATCLTIIAEYSQDIRNAAKTKVPEHTTKTPEHPTKLMMTYLKIPQSVITDRLACSIILPLSNLSSVGMIVRCVAKHSREEVI